MNIKKFFHLTLPLVALPITAQTVVPSNDVIDCGQVIYQEPVTVQFELVNEGETSVSISDVQTSCGCTTVSYPQEAVAAGASFTVSATYDAQQLGHFFKDIAGL